MYNSNKYFPKKNTNRKCSTLLTKKQKGSGGCRSWARSSNVERKKRSKDKKSWESCKNRSVKRKREMRYRVVWRSARKSIRKWCLYRNSCRSNFSWLRVRIDCMSKWSRSISRKCYCLRSNKKRTNSNK